MKKFIVVPILGLLFVLCTYGSRQTVVQKSDKSYLHFQGNTENVTVVIDEGEPFSLKEEKGSSRYSPNLLYQITPGKHFLKIYRGGELIIDRVIYVASNETKEVELR